MTQIQETLKAVVAEILEKYTFMFAEEVEADAFPPAGEFPLSASIHFRGPCSGTVTLTTNRELTVQLASNIIGEDPAAMSAEQADDGLKELLNVICGKFIVDLKGTDVVFDLSVPVIAPITDALLAAELAQSDAVPLVVDGLPLIAHARIQ